MDRVIVDASRSFAAGQVYVALSRCRSLEGIVLHSLITPGALREDPRIDRFSASHQAADELRSDVDVCRQLDLPAALEHSRSGNGTHLWLFFDEPVPASLARRLASHVEQTEHKQSRKPERPAAA